AEWPAGRQHVDTLEERRVAREVAQRFRQIAEVAHAVEGGDVTGHVALEQAAGLPRARQLAEAAAEGGQQPQDHADARTAAYNARCRSTLASGEKSVCTRWRAAAPIRAARAGSSSSRPIASARA